MFYPEVWILGEAYEAVASGHPFTKMCPTFESFTLSSCIVLLKSLRTTLKPRLNKLWSRSYVFQNKANVMCKCDKGGHPPNLLWTFGGPFWEFASGA